VAPALRDQDAAGGVVLVLEFGHHVEAGCRDLVDEGLVNLKGAPGHAAGAGADDDAAGRLADGDAECLGDVVDVESGWR